MNKINPLRYAPVAQPVEHVLGKDGVTGSIPVGGLFSDGKTFYERTYFVRMSDLQEQALFDHQEQEEAYGAA